MNFTITWQDGATATVEADDFLVEDSVALFHKKDDQGAPQRVYAAQWALVKSIDGTQP